MHNSTRLSRNQFGFEVRSEVTLVQDSLVLFVCYDLCCTSSTVTPLQLVQHTDAVSFSCRSQPFSVAGPAAWNCLSDELREPLLTANSFRQLLKTRLFAEY